MNWKRGYRGLVAWLFFFCLILEYLILFALGCTHNWGSVVGGFLLALPFVDDERTQRCWTRKKTNADGTQEQNEGSAGNESMEADERC